MQPPRGRDRNWPTVVLEVAVSRMLPSCTDLLAKLMLGYMNEVVEVLKPLPWQSTRSAGPTRRFGHESTSDSITKGPSGKRGMIAQTVLDQKIKVLEIFRWFHLK